MNDEPGWIFDDLGDGMASGPNAGPTVEFRNNPSYYLARESLQNSVDAWDPESKKPVKVIFEVKEINSQDLPGAEEMSAILNGCADYLQTKGSEDMAKELKSSAKIIKNGENMKVLRISDYNTIGMTEENWFRFGESVGFSNKGSGSGGSFGLGKGAYYSASGLFSIFTSSLYNNNKYRFSGKAILTTFELGGVRKQNNGTYGIKGQKSIVDREKVPHSFRKDFVEVFERTENGTDFLIPQFIGENNWDEELTKSILRFFWLPIHQGKLIIEINGTTTLTTDSLEENLHKYFDDESQDKVVLQKPNPIPFYYAYLNGIKDTRILEGLGEVNLFILVRDGYPNRIALIRKAGMVVDFPKKVSMNNFSAVFICENDKGNALLREMENQEHNEWNPTNAKTQDSRAKAQKAYKALDDYLKSSIQGLSASVEQKYLRLEGLDDYIYMETDEVEGSNGEEDENPDNNEAADVASVEDIGILSPEERTQSLKITVRPDIIDEGIRKHKQTIREVGSNRHKNVVGKGDIKIKPIKNLKIESFAEKTHDNGYLHHVVIQGTPNRRIDKLYILVGGEDKADVVAIKNARSRNGDKCSIEEMNWINNLGLDDSGNLHLLVTFEENGKFSLRISAYENR